MNSAHLTRSTCTDRRPSLSGHLPSPMPINDSFGFHMSCGGTNNSCDAIKEGCQLRPLHGAPYLEFSIQRAVHAAQWHHLFIFFLGPICSSRSSYTTDHPHALHLPETPSKDPSHASFVVVNRAQRCELHNLACSGGWEGQRVESCCGHFGQERLCAQL